MCEADYPTFNIRKVPRKALLKQSEEGGLFTPEYDYDKYPEAPTYTSTSLLSRPQAGEGADNRPVSQRGSAKLQDLQRPQADLPRHQE